MLVLDISGAHFARANTRETRPQIPRPILNLSANVRSDEFNSDSVI